MRYKDLPVEIQAKIKERTEEQGNIFNVKSHGNDKHCGGFTWKETPEGHNFWDDVLSRGRHHVFYERYPKEINFKKPFREGDVVKCISNSFNSNKEPIGQHFQLRKCDADKLNNDRVTSLISYPSGKGNEFRVNYSSTDLVIVARTEIKLSEQSKQTEKMETKSDFKEGEACLNEKTGTEYVVISGNLIGKVVTLKHHDGTSAPLFSYIDGDGDENSTFIAWKRLKRHSGEIPPPPDFNDEAYPEEEVGTHYLVFMGKWEGQIVELHHNDNSSMPRFKRADGVTSWLEWRCLKRTPQVIAEPSTDRYRIKTLEEFDNERPKDWDDDGDMNHLYGHDLTKEEIERYFQRNVEGKSDFRTDDGWWIRHCDIVKIETNNFTLNTTLNLTNNGKVNSNSSSSESLLFGIHATICVRPAPRGEVVSCSRKKILMGN